MLPELELERTPRRPSARRLSVKRGHQQPHRNGPNPQSLVLLDAPIIWDDFAPIGPHFVVLACALPEALRGNMKRLLTFAFCCLCVFTIPSYADDIADCDKLASHPDDPDLSRFIKGVAYEDIDGHSAVRSCKSAIAKRPEEGRLHVNLSRAYDKIGDNRSSMHHARQAADLGYPQGCSTLII